MNEYEPIIIGFDTVTLFIRLLLVGALVSGVVDILDLKKQFSVYNHENYFLTPLLYKL